MVSPQCLPRFQGPKSRHRCFFQLLRMLSVVMTPLLLGCFVPRHLKEWFFMVHNIPGSLCLLSGPLVTSGVFSEGKHMQISTHYSRDNVYECIGVGHRSLGKQRKARMQSDGQCLHGPPPQARPGLTCVFGICLSGVCTPSPIQ